MAAQKGDYDLVEFLLDHGSDPNCTTSVNPNTLEMVGVFSASTPLAAAVATSNAAITSLLLERGARLSFDFVSYHKLLKMAIQEGSVKVLEVLLKTAANLDPIPYGIKETVEALHAAMWRSKPCLHPKYEIIKLLVDYGYPVNDTSVKGGNALHHFLYALTLAGIEWDADHKKILRLLCEAGTDVNRLDYKGHRPLGIAIMQGLAPEAAEILMEYGTGLS